MKKTVKITIAFAIVFVILMNFTSILPLAYANDFYYAGVTDASYTRGKDKTLDIVGLLSEIMDYIFGLFLMGPRIVVVGWTALFEWALIMLIDKICDTDITGTNADDPEDSLDVFSSIYNVKNRITFEKIIFNKIDLFNADIFDLNPSGSTTGN